MNRKNFITSLGLISSVPFLNTGCQSTGTLDETDYQKLEQTLKQIATTVTVRFGKDQDIRNNLIKISNSLLFLTQDGKVDPNDLFAIILENVKNDDLALALTGLVSIYQIWFNDNTPSFDVAVPLVIALSDGIKAGLQILDNTSDVNSISKSKAQSVYRFKSVSLDNSVQALVKNLE